MERPVSRDLVVLRTAFLIAITLWLLPVPTAAQEPPVLVSPEVRPDSTVVFRLWAPKAIEVQLSGDWMTGPPVPLAKDGSGVWTVIQGPLDPNIYGYSFVVDGVRADDPMCRCTIGFTGGRGASSRFLIAAQPSAVWEIQNKPAGSLHHERFYSRSQQRMRGAIVYTPPGFDPKGARRYPVLVLLSGSPGDETEWTSGGADIVFDNLIAQGKMMPSIVVMHASDVDPKAPTRRGDQNLGQFERILVDELVPLVLQRYPVQTGASGWGIAGLSLGGEFAVYAGLRHPELFSYIASISGSLVPRGDPEEDLPSMDQRFGPALARPTIARNYKLIWIGCGNTDIICRGSRAFTQRLDAANVAHVWREYQGAHQMPVFRRELVDLLPLLFR